MIIGAEEARCDGWGQEMMAVFEKAIRAASLYRASETGTAMRKGTLVFTASV